MKSIRKQIILLLTTFVFAPVLCGAAYAGDTSNGGEEPLQSSQINQTETTNSTNETFSTQSGVESKMLKDVKMVVLTSRLQSVKPMVNTYENELVPAGYNFKLRIYDSHEVSLNPAYYKKFGGDFEECRYILHVPRYQSTYKQHSTFSQANACTCTGFPDSNSW